METADKTAFLMKPPVNSNRVESSSWEGKGNERRAGEGRGEDGRGRDGRVRDRRRREGREGRRYHDARFPSPLLHDTVPPTRMHTLLLLSHPQVSLHHPTPPQTHSHPTPRHPPTPSPHQVNVVRHLHLLRDVALPDGLPQQMVRLAELNG